MNMLLNQEFEKVVRTKYDEMKASKKTRDYLDKEEID